MPPASNTFTVTISDASGHSVVQSGVAAGSKREAALAALQPMQDESSPFALFVNADLWTITISQP